MRTTFIAFIALLFITANALPQNSTGETKRAELFVGYSNAQVDTGLGDIDDELGLDLDLDERESFHGFEVSGVVNVNRYLGLKADVSGHYNNRSFVFTVPAPGGGSGSVAFEAKNSLYNFLGGIQIKDNAKSGTFKPFAHAMVGAARARTKVGVVGCSVGIDCSDITDGSETGFAGAFGGGVDVRLSNRIQLRLIQVDYNPIWFDGARQNNVRFGFGLVF